MSDPNEPNMSEAVEEIEAEETAPEVEHLRSFREPIADSVTGGSGPTIG